MFRNLGSFFLASAMGIALPSCTYSCRHPRPGKETSPAAFIIAPADNAKVRSPFTVDLGLRGMNLEGGGPNESGLHHLLIDNPRGFVPAGTPILSNDQTVHFAEGQTTATIELPPGLHSLAIQFGDKQHLSYGRAMSDSIRIVVVKE
jgi:hypothetical protein